MSPGSRSGGGGRSSSPSRGRSNSGISTNRQSLNRNGNINSGHRGYSAPEYNFSGGYTNGYYGVNPSINIHYELVPVINGILNNGFSGNISNISCQNPYSPCSTPLTVINQPGSNFNFLSYE